MLLSKKEVQTLVQKALKEDIGKGDMTALALIPQNLKGVATVTLKEEAIICGLFLLKYFFPKSFEVTCHYKDGKRIKKNTVLLKIKGNYRILLERERTFLNFLGHLSGIATLTHHFVTSCNNKDIKIMDTRKTTPLLRGLQKYAVKIGGGSNHRKGLYDEVLIKENHINAVGGVYKAVSRAHQKYPNKKIEIEVRSLKEVKEALRASASILLLDNMSLPHINKSIKIIKNKAHIEVSGGVTLKNIKKYGHLKINRISIGALTHSSHCIDLSMWIEKYG
ncbi:MAG: carboxylating nicotinate-nucleotide diphosphorylase [Deltaproteobacteria bacterium]|nr:carboxylating nicotinate-nucleotide diphosphorylase [Deltaproteobacteria bacterium]